MQTRRQFGKLALAGLAAPLIAGKIDSRIQGVQLGVHTFSYSGLPREGILDTIIRSMVDIGIGECILLAQQIEPADLWGQIRPPAGTSVSADAQARARDQLAQWRVSVSLDSFRVIRKQFEDAGIEIYGFGASPNPNPSAAELERTFEIARALGARIVTLGGSLTLAKLLAPFAEKHQMPVGLQGHPSMTNADPDPIARPEHFETALSLSKSMRLSFDIGDATGAGFDTLKFVQEHRERIDSVYLKDRRKDRASVPWGEGDTPIRQILRWIRDEHQPIRAFIDCDYKSDGDRTAEVKRCFAYAKAALA